MGPKIGGVMKIYIAGKITGDPDYKEKFAEVAEELRQRGDSVMNPACLSEDKEFCWDDYMAISSAMQKTCDATVLLPDWQESRGARIEAHRAVELGQQLFLRIEAPRAVELGQQLFLLKIDSKCKFQPYNLEHEVKCQRCNRDIRMVAVDLGGEFCPWCGQQICMV